MKKAFTACVGIILCFLVLWLWALPFWRVVKFVFIAFKADSEEGSLNAHGDLVYAYWLLFSYIIGLTVSLCLVWALIRTRAAFLLIPLVLSVGVTLEIVRIHPEEVIVLFPAIIPRHLIAVYLLLGVPGVMALLPDPAKKRFAKTTA
jgi:hypothetical protein